MSIVNLFAKGWNGPIKVETPHISVREIAATDAPGLLTFIHRNLAKIQSVSPTYTETVDEMDVRGHIQSCLRARASKSATLLCFSREAENDILATVDIDPVRETGWMELGIMPGTNCPVAMAAEVMNALPLKLAFEGIVSKGVCAYPLANDYEGRRIYEQADFSFREIMDRPLAASGGTLRYPHAVYERPCV